MKVVVFIKSGLLVLVLGIIVLIYTRKDRVPQFVTTKEYPEVMTDILDGLGKKGYAIEKIQPIDEGLKKAGFDIPKYRIIFYYPKSELAWIQKNYPKFSVLLPLSVTVAVQGEKIVVLSPPFDMLLKNADSVRLLAMVNKWKMDSEEVFKKATKD